MSKKSDLTSGSNAVTTELTEAITKARSNKSSKKVAGDNINSLHSQQCNELSKTEYSNDDKIDIRCFYLQDGKVFFGVLFSENADSFLVGAVARLGLMEDKSIQAHSITSQAVIRLMKSSVIFVTSPDGYKYHYYKYLLEDGVGLLPDYMTDERISYLESEVDKAEKLPKVKPTSKKEVHKSEGELEEEFEEITFPIILSRAIH